MGNGKPVLKSTMGNGEPAGVTFDKAAKGVRPSALI